MDTPPRHLRLSALRSPSRSPSQSSSTADSSSSPYKRADPHSPSRQLLWELSQLQLADQQAHQARLDRDAETRARAHREALVASEAEHERIRQVAEAVRLQAELAAQMERQAERDRELAELDRMRREKEARERAAAEAAKRRRAEEVERQRIAEAEKAEAEARRKKVDDAPAKAAPETINRDEEIKKKHWEKERIRLEQEKRSSDQEAERSRRDEEEKAKKEAATAAVRRAQQAKTGGMGSTANTSSAKSPDGALVRGELPVGTSPVGTPITNGTSTQGGRPWLTTLSEKERIHARYLEIHKKLKEFRQWFVEEAKTDAKLKEATGEGRRNLRKWIGQLTSDTKKNRTQRDNIINCLSAAGRFKTPTMDITTILANPPCASGPDTQVPALMVYLMNILLKATLNQFMNEANVETARANYIGIICSTVLAHPNTKWNGIPMTDILVAKLHLLCPVLFGIYGDESTPEGKSRVGWAPVKDMTGARVDLIPRQRHHDRMTGLGAGFAALTLRNFERSPGLDNGYPPWHFWHAVACITNVPAGQVQETHCLVLAAMFAGTEVRILELFGDAGKVMLKHVLVHFAFNKAPRSLVGTKSLQLIAPKLEAEKKLFLRSG